MVIRWRWIFTLREEDMRPRVNPSSRRVDRLKHSAYRIIAVGLYDDQANSLDLAAQKLQEAGFLKANRSFVIQALVRRLQRDIEGMNADAILDYFLERHLRRSPVKATSRRSTTGPPRTNAAGEV